MILILITAERLQKSITFSNKIALTYRLNAVNLSEYIHVS